MHLTHWYDRNSGVATEFLRGFDYYLGGDFRTALGYFTQAVQGRSNEDAYLLLYQAYLGLVKLMLGYQSAIELCRYAAHFEHYEVDVHYVLALAELRLGNRWRALNAIRMGLTIEPEHKRLKKLQMFLRQRRRPFFKKLSRDHYLNRVLGKITWLLQRHSLHN